VASRAVARQAARRQAIRIAKKWNLAGTPTIYLLDHKGVIRHKWLGGAREKVIDNAVEKLIQEVETGAK